MQETTATKEDAQWQQRCATLYNAWVQLRYHRRRQRFFDLADKITKALTITLGASLFGQYIPIPWVATSITAIGLLALVFSYSDRKQQHADLAARAADLASRVEAKPFASVSDEDLAAWQAEYAQLCAKAPPPLKTLTLLCEREQSNVDGHPEHVPMPPYWRRMLADFKS